MRYRKPADIDSERDNLLDEMSNKDSEHHKLWRMDKNHPIVKAKQAYLNDLGAAFFPSKRGRPVSDPTEAFPEKNPAKAGYWLDHARDREELYKSTIIETLSKSNATEQQLQELIADLLVNNVGVIESGIDNIQTYRKSDNNIHLPSGKNIPVEKVQAHFDRLSIRAALFQLLTFNEKMLEARQKSSALRGGPHPKKTVTLQAKLEKWIIRKWREQGWRTQDSFISKLKDIVSSELEGALKEMSTSQIKKLLPPKNKNSDNKK